jgi:hypothetical protein
MPMAGKKKGILLIVKVVVLAIMDMWSRPSIIAMSPPVDVPTIRSKKETAIELIPSQLPSF